MQEVPARAISQPDAWVLPAPVDLLGTPLHPVTMAQAVGLVEQAVAARRPLRHLAMNAAKLVALHHDETLRSAAASADLVTADGQAVVWAARVLRRPVPERVTGIDLMDASLALAARCGHRVFMLGARPEVLRDAVAALRRRFPGLRIVGAIHGCFPPHEEAAVVRQIAAARPDMLFVALSSPRKEQFLADHEGQLAIPFCMGVGGSLDVIAGRVRRAPRPLQRLGLEWFFRLIQEPRRLWRRYLRTNTKFVGLVARAAWRARRSDAAVEGLSSPRG